MLSVKTKVSGFRWAKFCQVRRRWGQTLRISLGTPWWYCDCDSGILAALSSSAPSPPPSLSPSLSHLLPCSVLKKKRERKGRWDKWRFVSHLQYKKYFSNCSSSILVLSSFCLGNTSKMIKQHRFSRTGRNTQRHRWNWNHGTLQYYLPSLLSFGSWVGLYPTHHNLILCASWDLELWGLHGCKSKGGDC